MHIKGNGVNVLSRITVFFLCLVLLGVPSLNSAQQPQPTRGARGLLFEISNGSEKVYVFGTIHAANESFYPLPQAVVQALSASSAVYLETDPALTPASRPAVNALSALAEGDDIRDGMDPALVNSLDNLLPRIGMKWDSISRIKPWMLALRLSSVYLKSSGLDTSWSNEEYIAGFARAQGKPVEGFETIMEQLQLYDAAPLPEQYAYLRGVIDDVAAAPATGKKNRLASAWLAGNAADIEETYRRTRKVGQSGWPTLWKHLFDDRNERFERQITHILRTRSPSFIAVGTLHLVGETSVIARLQARGLKARLISE